MVYQVQVIETIDYSENLFIYLFLAENMPRPQCRE